jgi:glycine/D-amino acid oxidase-like deaminating enzyme
MPSKIAIVGAGIIGITNAICLLEKGFSVTIFTKDEPLKTKMKKILSKAFGQKIF